MKRRQKGILAVILVLLVGAGIFAYHHHEEAAKQAAARELTLSGNVDVREVTLSFRGSDRVKDILVEEGDTVEEGQVLARLDTDELNINLRKTKAQIAAQQSTVAKLHNGTRAEEIAQAQQRYKAAEAAASNAQGIYERRQAVYDSVEGVSEQDLDNARSQAEAKQAELEAAKEALREARNGPRSEDIEAAEANLQALEEEQSREEYLLSQYELRAPMKGVIRSRLLEVGDMASPSTPVFTSCAQRSSTKCASTSMTRRMSCASACRPPSRLRSEAGRWSHDGH